MAKKDNTTTYLLAAAAAAGAFFLFRKKASAATTPPDTFDRPDDTEPPQDDPAPQGTPKRDAPPMQGGQTQATKAGKMVVDTYIDQINAVVLSEMNLGPDHQGPPPEANEAEVAAVRQLFSIPDGRTIASWVTDAAYYGMFKGNIPAEANRGTGWDPYIAVWKALWKHAKAGLLFGVNKH